MSEVHPHEGPLHLRKHLGPCSEALAKAMHGSVSHPVTLLRSIHCSCPASGRFDAAAPLGSRSSPELVTAPKLDPETAARISGRRAAVPPDPERSGPCHIFHVELNDEDGVFKSFCRRCQKMFIVFDQALYWGMRRKTGFIPRTYPYRCSCGGHAFELGLGFDYYEDALDENDIRTITVAVRCAACDEISVILDEEAS
ncbi:MAG: hypothetical protein KIS92_20770 [Planctomycetota bacterium]|nr:hypothetical protein [Planctomycetota bacterium]